MDHWQLKTGTYIIKNVHFQSTVFLHDSIAIVSGTDDSSAPCAKWIVELLGEKTYLIRNHGHGLYANYKLNPSAGTIVPVGDRPQEWRITGNEKGYTICPSSNASVCWRLSNSASKTEITFAAESASDCENLWLFTMVSEAQTTCRCDDNGIIAVNAPIVDPQNANAEGEASTGSVTLDTVHNTNSVSKLVREISSHALPVGNLASDLMSLDGSKRADTLSDTIPTLIQLISSDNNDVCEEAAAVLATLNTQDDACRISVDAQAIPALTGLLDSSHPKILQHACTALANIFATLPQARISSASGLQAIIPPLVRLLSHANPEIQAPAVAAFASISATVEAQQVSVRTNAIPCLVKLLTSDDVTVVHDACEALKNTCATLVRARNAALTANAIPPLVRLLSHGSIRIQAAAAFALANINLLNEAQKVTVEADDALPLLVKLLSSNDPTLLHAACEALTNACARQPRARIVVLKAGGVPSLTRLRFQDNAQTRRKAAQVLASINIEMWPYLRHSKGLRTMISMTCSSQPRFLALTKSQYA